MCMKKHITHISKQNTLKLLEIVSDPADRVPLSACAEHLHNVSDI